MTDIDVLSCIVANNVFMTTSVVGSHFLFINI